MPLLGIKAVEYNPFKLDCAPDQYNTQEMCDKAFEKSPESLEYAPYEYNTKVIYEGVALDQPETMEFVSYMYKAKEICETVFIQNSLHMKKIHTNCNLLLTVELHCKKCGMRPLIMMIGL